MSQDRLFNTNHAMHKHDLGRQIYYWSGHCKAVLRDLNGSWGFQYVYENGMPGSIKFIRRTASEAMDAFFAHKTFPRRPRYLQHEERRPLTVLQAGMDAMKEGMMLLPPMPERREVEIRVPMGVKVNITYY